MSKDNLIEWGFGLSLLLLTFLLGIIPYDIRNIAMGVLLILLTAVCVIKLIISVRFRIAVKNGLTTHLTGHIVFKFGFKGRNIWSCTHAWARYTLNGKDMIGVMICSVGRQLRLDQPVEIIVPKSGLKTFAFDEKQTRDAVLTYAVFSLVTVAVLAVILVCFVMTMR